MEVMMENIKVIENTNSESKSNTKQPNSTILDNSISDYAITEYKEITEPCVALTIIGENRLTNAEIFAKRGFKFSFKAFLSTLVLTILNMFI